MKPLERLVADLERAISRHKFGVLGVHALRAKMVEKGVSFARECRAAARRLPSRPPWIAFVDDYDMHVAHHLVAGVDVWLASQLLLREPDTVWSLVRTFGQGRVSAVKRSPQNKHWRGGKPW